MRLSLVVHSKVPTVVANPTSPEVDAYIAAASEPQRSVMTSLRACIRDIVPEAEECISYAMPGYRLRGKVVAGFAAFKKHVGFFPHSGQVFKEIPDALAQYKVSAKGGGMHLPLDQPVPVELIAQVIDVRIHQAFPDGLPE